jgi:hypothetical protein
VRELDSVDYSLGTDDIGYVTNGGTGCGTKVKNLASWTDLLISSCTREKVKSTYVNVIKTTEDTSCKLTPERIPNSVLDLLLFTLGICCTDRDPLFTVDRMTWGHVSGNEQMLLALGDVDTGVLVGFKGDGTWSSTTSGCSSSTSSAYISVIANVLWNG